MTLRDRLVPVPAHITPDMTLLEAAQHLHSAGDTVVPVVRNGILAGVLTMAMIQRHAAQEGLAAGNVRVAQVMLSDDVSCYVDDPEEQALERLGALGFDRLPAIDRTGRLVGMYVPKVVPASGDLAGSAAGHVQGVSDPEAVEGDNIDVTGEESFPASDPPPPPSRIGTA